MLYRIVVAALVATLSQTGLASAQEESAFKRERNERTGQAKDALEGKVAPALKVSDWMNTGGKALDLKALRGKVVILDFWGTW